METFKEWNKRTGGSRTSWWRERKSGKKYDDNYHKREMNFDNDSIKKVDIVEILKGQKLAHMIGRNYEIPYHDKEDHIQDATLRTLEKSKKMKNPKSYLLKVALNAMKKQEAVYINKVGNNILDKRF